MEPKTFLTYWHAVLNLSIKIQSLQSNLAKDHYDFNKDTLTANQLLLWVVVKCPYCVLKLYLIVFCLNDILLI